MKEEKQQTLHIVQSSIPPPSEKLDGEEEPQGKKKTRSGHKNPEMLTTFVTVAADLNPGGSPWLLPVTWATRSRVQAESPDTRL